MAKTKTRRARSSSNSSGPGGVPERRGLDLARVSPLTLTMVAAGVHLVLMAAVFDPTVFTGGDNGVYVALSRSLLERHAYLNVHDPSGSAHTLYPPGYPLILALASLVGIHPWVPIKVLAAAISVAAVGMTALWLHRRSTPGVALFASLMVAISPGLLRQGHQELSDVPAWAFVMVALWALEALPREGLGRVALAGLATALAYLTRSAAIPLVVAGLGWLALERRWRQLAVFAALVLPAVAAWSWWTGTHAGADPTYGEYTSVFWLKDHYRPELGRASIGDLLLRPVINAYRYGALMIPLLLTGRAGGVLGFVGTAVIGLSLVGWALRVRRPGAVELFFPLYAGMLAVLPPPWAGERYLFPIFPLALAYALEGGRWLVARWRPAAVPLVGAAAAAVLLITAFRPLTVAVRVGHSCRVAYRPDQRYACLPPQWGDYLTTAEWARSGLPEEAVVISRKPGLFYALSDRRGIDIPKTSDPDQYLDAAGGAGARYVVIDRVDGLTEQYSVPAVQRYPTTFCVVRVGTVEGSVVLGIRRDVPRVSEENTGAVTLQECPSSFGPAPAVG